MEYKTDKDIVNRALKNMTIASSQSDVDATDFQDALDVYKVFHSYLTNRYKRTVRWNFDKVPSDVWIYISDMLASELLSTFSLSDRAEARVVRSAIKSEAMFREYITRKPKKVVEIQQL